MRFLATAIVAFTLSCQSLSAIAADRVDFQRDVRPILSDKCFYCHGPDKNHREADLRLDVREEALEYGAIIPGEPEESMLIERIFSDDPDVQMPPPEAHKTLTAAHKEMFRRWVAEGAVYDPHWAYVAPTAHEPPKFDHPLARIHNPIDVFVQARLFPKGLGPAAEADRRALLRRLSLDLIGLPPTPDEVAAFVADQDPAAYERAIDRLLKSPHFGERMATPWLDVVRYADTVGFHGDQNQNAWAYRDYVIRSFNDNKPFDTFTIEQLAGDLLPNASAEQRLATCFNRLNMMTREGGAQPKEYLAMYQADRVRTVGMAWLGSTFACAECHDHKFDPIKTKDFYSLSAFFGDIKQWGVYSDYSYTPNPDLRGWTNEYPFPPEITVDSPYLAHRIERKRQQIVEVVRAVGGRISADPLVASQYEAWRHSSLNVLKQNPSAWQSLTPLGSDSGDAVFAGKSSANDEIRFELAEARMAAIRIELLPPAPQHGSILRSGSGGSATVKIAASLQTKDSGKAQSLRFRHAAADLAEPRYASGHEVIGILDGWKTVASRSNETHTGTWLLSAPLSAAKGDTLLISLPNNPIGRVRVSVSPLASSDINRLDAAGDVLDALQAPNAAGSLAVQEAYLRSTAWDTAAYQQVITLDREILTCRNGRTPVMVTEAKSPIVTRVLPRGNWQDDSGEIVGPAVPHFLPQVEATDRRLTRLDLANWLVSSENPLTARVVMNRMWKQFFGTGLSAGVDDLGAQGEAPSHPQLLDWLAVEFRESGWDVKHMVKLIVMSSTYRQSSQPNPKALEIDPENRLLSHQSPRRLEAEVVRDNALAVAGLLNLDIGGPPCKPYQPANYYENLQFPDRPYVADADERQYRRGVYTHWQRTFLHPMLVNFDAPSREDCIALRTQANTPQQALTLLNDPTFVEASRVLAAKVLATETSSDEQRLEWLYQRALARAVKPHESESMLEFLEQLKQAYRDKPDDAGKLLNVGFAPRPTDVDLIELAAWTNVCRVVLNLHETITRY